MANTKISLYLSDELLEYLEKQCEAYGMGKSAYISMVLTIYRQQCTAMNEMSKIDAYISRFEKLVADNNLKTLD